VKNFTRKFLTKMFNVKHFRVFFAGEIFSPRIQIINH